MPTRDELSKYLTAVFWGEAECSSPNRQLSHRYWEVLRLHQHQRSGDDWSKSFFIMHFRRFLSVNRFPKGENSRRGVALLNLLQKFLFWKIKFSIPISIELAIADSSQAFGNTLESLFSSLWLLLVDEGSRFCTRVSNILKALKVWGKTHQKPICKLLRYVLVVSHKTRF